MLMKLYRYGVQCIRLDEKLNPNREGHITSDFFILSALIKKLKMKMSD